jgi:uncharacterized membrane protein
MQSYALQSYVRHRPHSRTAILISGCFEIFYLVAKSDKIFFNALQTGLEVIILIFIIMTAENIKIITCKVDKFLAPVKIIRPFFVRRR